MDFSLRLTEEEGTAITNWAKAATNYLVECEIVATVLGERFHNRADMKLYILAIQYQIELGMPECDRKVMNETKHLLNNGDHSPEKKSAMKSRRYVQNKINRIYNKLLDELFPIFRREVIADLLPEEEEEDTIPKPSRSPAEKHSLDDPFRRQLEEEEEGELNLEGLSIKTDGEEEDERDDISRLIAPEDDEEESSSPLALRIPTAMAQASRSRFNRSTPSNEQDLFETPRSCVELLRPRLDKFKRDGLVMFEPCHGNGAITNYLEEMGLEVITRDLYTMEEPHDYLKAEDPQYDILITNPVSSYYFCYAKKSVYTPFYPPFQKVFTVIEYREYF